MTLRWQDIQKILLFKVLFGEKMDNSHSVLTFGEKCDIIKVE